KYAVRALAETLYFELKPAGVSVTMVCPGTIGTEFRLVNNQGDLKPGAKEMMHSVIIMDPATAGRQIKRAIDRRKRETVITFHAKFGVWMRNHCAGIYAWIIARARSYIEKTMHERVFNN